MSINQKQISDLIAYNSNQVIIFDKPSGLPVHRDLTGDFSLHQMAESYCKHPLNIVHRLDRPSSGVTIFAKNKKATISLSQQFKERSLEKKYLVVVPTMKSLKDSERLIMFLKHDTKRNKSFVSDGEGAGGKKSILEYTRIASSEHYTLLSVLLETGRHHQIRAQLAHIGCPIKGDVKYGARRGNKNRSIHLHAWKVAFSEPITNEKVNISILPPKEDNLWEYFIPYVS